MMLADDSSRIVRHTWLVSELAANQDSVTESLGWVRFMSWSTQTEMEHRAVLEIWSGTVNQCRKICLFQIRQCHLGV